MIFAMPAQAEVSAETCAANFAKMRVYYIMPRIFKDGTLDDVATALPDLKKMGVNTLWVGPPHPQTTYDDGLAGFNNHGYWPSNHATVDEDLGGAPAFRRLLQTAEKIDVKIALDVVLNHFGFGFPEYKIGGKKIAVDNPKYFKVKEADAPLIHPRERELWALLENERDPVKLKAYQDELSRYPLFGLAALEHDNPAVAKYLINSYKKFVDEGVDIFRVDAPKHMRMSFLHKFTNEMTTHAAKSGRKLQFIWELLFDSPHTLNVFAGDVLSKVKDPKSILFMDFPLAKELRKLQDPAYSLENTWNFLRTRQKENHRMKNYIPMVENHDFEGPIKDKFRSNLIYALSEFTGEHPTILHHGSEVTGAAKDGRPLIKAVNPNGDKAQLLKSMSDVMADYRALPDGTPLIPHYTTDGSLVLERRISPERSIFIAANTTGKAGVKKIQLPRGAGSKLKVVASDGDATLEMEKGRVDWKFTPNSMLVFEVTK